MEISGLNVGDTVKAVYKTGEYIGEIVELSPPKAVVQIAAVLKHPTQGDLHQPMDPDVAFFHQRRALAFREKARVFLAETKPYHGDVPDYAASLRLAVSNEIRQLRLTGKWIERSLQELEVLQKEYFPND